ncbi:hypothetical protein D3C78_1357270 [compost metagenome]
MQKRSLRRQPYGRFLSECLTHLFVRRLTALHHYKKSRTPDQSFLHAARHYPKDQADDPEISRSDGLRLSYDSFHKVKPQAQAPVNHPQQLQPGRPEINAF